MIFALRTDTPEAQLYLLDESGQEIARDIWLAERRLARELLGRMEALLKANEKQWADISGLVVYHGPGSFTGLRIGITVMNTIAYAQHVPIVGVGGEDWLGAGVERISAGEDDKVVLPEYGADARITKPRK